MTKSIIQFIILFFILVLLQVLACNKISIFNVATPFLFIFLFVRLPLTLSVNWVMTIGFFTGLIVDIFSDTQGMNALASTIACALRSPMMKLYIPRKEEISDPIPSSKSLGPSTFLKYVLTFSSCYCFIIVFIEAFTLHNILLSLVRVIACTVLTVILLYGIDSIVTPNHEKRL